MVWGNVHDSSVSEKTTQSTYRDTPLCKNWKQIPENMSNCVWWNGSIMVFNTGAWNHSVLIITLALVTAQAPWESVFICKTGIMSVSFTIKLGFCYMKKKCVQAVLNTKGVTSTWGRTWYITEHYVSDLKNDSRIIYAVKNFSKINVYSYSQNFFN